MLTVRFCDAETECDAAICYSREILILLLLSSEVDYRWNPDSITTSHPHNNTCIALIDFSVTVLYEALCRRMDVEEFQKSQSKTHDPRKLICED